MTYDHIVSASLLLAGITIGWLTLNEFQRLMHTGWYRRPNRPRVYCITRKVWDSNETQEK
jgi:hypothetical protein